MLARHERQALGRVHDRSRDDEAVVLRAGAGDALVLRWINENPAGRGSGWETVFYNCATKRQVFIHSDRPPIAAIPNKKYSNLHPDPHPQFVMNGRYIVSSFNCDEPRRMTVSITPTHQLWKMTAP